MRKRLKVSDNLKGAKFGIEQRKSKTAYTTQPKMVQKKRSNSRSAKKRKPARGYNALDKISKKTINDTFIDKITNK